MQFLHHIFAADSLFNHKGQEGRKKRGGSAGRGVSKRFIDRTLESAKTEEIRPHTVYGNIF